MIQIYPAIDLKDGKCVRLVKGDMNRATIYADDPARQARLFESAGCRWLHMVDLDGAFDGATANGEAIREILAATSVKTQLGGGIRNLQTMEKWLDLGVSRLILGTLAVKNPGLVKEAARLFPGKIAVGIDARAGLVAVEGWAKTSEMTASDLGKRFEDAGIAAIIFTDIDRDGTLTGPNITATAMLAENVDIPVIASGGVSSMADIQTIAQTGVIEGVVVGKALYDERISLDEISALQGQTSC